MPDARGVRRRFLLLTTLRWVPVGLVFPVTVLVMTSRGLDLAAVGAVLAVQGVVVLALELPTGGLADALGRRPVLVVAGLANVASLVVFLLARDPLVFATAIGLQGLHRALDSGPLESWYVDAAQAADPDADIEGGLARAGVLIGAGIAGGSLVAGVAPRLVPGLSAAPDAVLTPLTLPVLLAAVVGIGQVAAVALLVHEVRPARGAAALRRSVAAVPGVIAEALRLVRRSRAVAALIGIEALWGVGLVAVEVGWQPRLADLLGGAADATEVFGVTSAGIWGASAAGSALVPLLVRRLGGDAAVAGLVAKLLQGATLVGLALAGGPLPMILALGLFYVGNGAAAPVHNGLLHRQVGPGARTTLLSVNSLTGQGGGMVGTVAFGALAAAAGIPPGWIAAAAVMAVSGPLYLLARARPRHEAALAGQAV